MAPRDLLQLVLFFGILAALTIPCGAYFEAVFDDRDHFLKRFFGWAETFINKVCCIDSKEDQDWTVYSLHLLTVCALSVVFNYVILRLQHRFTLNPQGLGPLPSHLSLNAAIGFITGTAWTSYSSETAMSYFSQMVGLTFQNFMSAATGICVEPTSLTGFYHP